MERSLNVDIPERVSEFEVLLKKVLPKNILYRLVRTKGFEFDGYRGYANDEDASNIDWKASVRANQLLARRYIEEQDLKFMFFIDVSDDMVFGSTEKLKCEFTAEFSAALIHLILIAGSKAGFVLFSDKVVKMILPQPGRKLFDSFCYEISDPLNYGGNSDLNFILEEFTKTMNRDTSLVFLISDFIKMDSNYKKNLEILSGIFETIAIIVRDPLDMFLPLLNKEIVIEDPESGEKILINPKVAKNAYEFYSAEQLKMVKKIFEDCDIDFLELYTKDSSSERIAEFIKERIRGGRKQKFKNVP